MAAWIEVVEPVTGVTVTVQEGSPHALLWGAESEDVDGAQPEKRTRAKKSA